MLSFCSMRALVMAVVLLAGTPACRRSDGSHPATASTQAATQAPRSASECKACNGEWGVHGLLQVESCLCRTHDSGKVCHDGLECEGECVVEDGKLQVIEPGPPRRGYFLGRCSEFDHVFGCNKLLMDGTGTQPISLEEPPGEVCVD
jgi:hypothetical protein